MIAYTTKLDLSGAAGIRALPSQIDHHVGLALYGKDRLTRDVQGKPARCLNFASNNYLDLAGHPRTPRSIAR